MAKQVKIKDIAAMAGVSAGTVDRVLHGRGGVSKESTEAVEKVLADVGYRYNIHASAISLRKEYNIVIGIPTAGTGEYWSSILAGIERAMEEFSDIKIKCKYAYYNQFDIYSCRSAFENIVMSSPDAVIVGPTFDEETLVLCSDLDVAGIPYVFVDSVIDGTNPVGTFTTDQYACGRLMGRLLDSICPKGSEFAVFRNLRVGNHSAHNSVLRKEGMMDYFAGCGHRATIHETSFSVLTPEDNKRDILDFMEKHPKVKGVAALNSRGYIIADLIAQGGFKDVKMISFDLTANNEKSMRAGSIEILLCQRPALQGFLAVKTLISHLLYKRSEARHLLMPIDIVMKQNIDYYKEFVD